MNSSKSNLSFLDLINLGSAGLGVYNTILNEKQITNDELFERVVKELKFDLENQNKTLINEIKKLVKGSDNMENYEKMEKEVCDFKKYTKMAMDLMTDSFKWKKLAEYCDNPATAEKYKSVSDTLYNLFMTEHNRIGEMLKE